MADQLHFIDEQLLPCELSPGDEAAVDEFRVWSLQLRQQRHKELGHFPDDMVERSAWQAKKQHLDESMEPEIESERLLRGQSYLQGEQAVAQQLSETFESENQHPARRSHASLGEAPRARKASRAACTPA